MAEKLLVTLGTSRGLIGWFYVLVEGDETPHELAVIIRRAIEKTHETESAIIGDPRHGRPPLRAGR
jgi:hypothetical protein